MVALPTVPKSEGRNARSVKLWQFCTYDGYYTIMNPAAVIEQLKETQQTLANLLALLESGERDRFAAHLYQSRREYRLVYERGGKGGKQIERCIISTFQVAESMGFKGEFRQWEPPRPGRRSAASGILELYPQSRSGRRNASRSQRVLVNSPINS